MTAGGQRQETAIGTTVTPPFGEEMTLRSRRLGVPAIAFSIALAAMLSPATAQADWPMGYLTGHGTRAYAILNLTWGVLLISLVVIAITIILLIGGIIRSGWSRAATSPEESAAIIPSIGGLSWLSIGVGLSTVVLFAVGVWTVVTLAMVTKARGDLSNASPAGFELEVIAHQWWWEVRYISPDVARGFTTANEIHIPMGRPVRVKLRGVDVIHSFWIPALGGKTDVIPGQVNETWLEASQPGTYRGQCTEFCGRQHANMALYAISDPPEKFAAWWENQLRGAAEASTGAEIAEQNSFVRSCGICHALRGTRAQGVLGPNLSHLMTRNTIAAGILPNDPGHLSAWIADPQSFKPGTLMPRLDLSGPEFDRIRRFLERLK